MEPCYLGILDHDPANQGPFEPCLVRLSYLCKVSAQIGEGTEPDRPCIADMRTSFGWETYLSYASYSIFERIDGLK